MVIVIEPWAFWLIVGLVAARILQNGWYIQRLRKLDKRAAQGAAHHG